VGGGVEVGVMLVLRPAPAGVGDGDVLGVGLGEPVRVGRAVGDSVAWAVMVGAGVDCAQAARQSSSAAMARRAALEGRGLRRLPNWYSVPRQRGWLPPASVPRQRDRSLATICSSREPLISDNMPSRCVLASSEPCLKADSGIPVSLALIIEDRSQLAKLTASIFFARGRAEPRPKNLSK